MKKIGIIGAMELEVEELKSQMEEVTVKEKASMEFYAGVLEGKKVVVVRSGIGKVNAAVCTQILIDDFGSGISSFSTVRDYEFDIIKLDMGFVQKIGTSKKTDNILIALIDLAHSLDMKVIAEGVETKEQTEVLKKNGCDYFQGFYYAKPMSQDEFEAMLDREL